MKLLEKIESRSAVISVIGLGYVGLPLAVVFAEAGFRVIGIDLDRNKVEAIGRGQSYIDDISSEQLTRLTVRDGEGRGLRATSDYDALNHADVVIVCVPTPLSKTRAPDLSHIVSATEEIAKRLRRDMLIVLESTTYPGTTEEIILPHIMQNWPAGSPDQAPRVGEDFFLAFSPERIDPGRSDWAVKNTPKVIGGMTPECGKIAKTLYERSVDRVVLVSSPKVAEMVKLLENTFRATNIALVNEIAIMCGKLGVDVWEVIEAAKTKPFGFMAFYPGPGLGGHCIPVDPQYLAWKLRTLDYNARFIQLAEEINFGMPEYVLNKVSDALNEQGKPLKDSHVLIIGVTYKADVGDMRESPALDLIELLSQKGAKVDYHDPFIPQFELDGLSMKGIELDLKALQQADCVVITAAHKSYDWNWIVENSRLVVDTRNATRDVAKGPIKVIKL